jgi:hypothetical protein
MYRMIRCVYFVIMQDCKRITYGLCAQHRKVRPLQRRLTGYISMFRYANLASRCYPSRLEIAPSTHGDRRTTSLSEILFVLPHLQKIRKLLEAVCTRSEDALNSVH